MTFSDSIHIEAENMAAALIHVNKARNELKPVDLETLDTPEPPKYASKTEEILARYPEPAQETEAEREYRHRQIEYERGPSFEKNKALAKSINALANQNFTNRVLAAACDFTEMAEKHPRSGFIGSFGDLIKEELESDPSKPSKRLASFTTTYFWKEANWARIAAAVRPDTSRDELMEFFTLPLNSEPDKKVIDRLPERIIGRIIFATSSNENKAINFNFRQEKPYIPLEECDKLEKSVTEFSQQNFTNRLLASTIYFKAISNPFNTIRSVREFMPAIHQELKENPDKPSPTLATIALESPLRNEDIKLFKESVTPKTTKAELAEFFGTREKWSTGLRMIDYLNHHVVMGMTQHLPEKDRLDLWFMKPEMIYDFNASESLRAFSPDARRKILDTVQDPVQKGRILENMDNRLIGLHVSIGLMGGGNVDPNTLDICGNFATVRRRRICSHADNRHYFAAHERFRSAY